MAFAYGSGVFAQQTAAEARAERAATLQEPPMIDLVFAVDDPTSWHAENLIRNRHHYSIAAYGGASFIARTQETAASVWYNTLVPVPTPWGDGRQLMKYGVISSRALEEDLNTWSSFYISGRMQKPIAWVDGYSMQDSRRDSQGTEDTEYQREGKRNSSSSSSSRVQESKGRTLHPTSTTSDNHHHNHQVDLIQAGQNNLRGAVAAALLQLPSTFTEGQLYETITGLSYSGDFRMAIAENPDKITNIVRNGGSPTRFRELYGGIVDTMDSVVCLEVEVESSSGVSGVHDDAHILGVSIPKMSRQKHGSQC